MRKIGYTLLILTFIPYFMSGCAKNAAPNAVTTALALSAISRASSEPSPIASAQAAASATSSSISSAASNGQITGFNLNQGRPERLMAMVRQKAIHRILKSSVPGVIPTNLSGGTCTPGSCTGTLTGTTSCPMGGTVTLKGVNVTLTYSSPSTGQYSYSNSMNGPITFTQCAVQAMDFGNFPNIIMPVISGDMSYNGSLNMNISSFTSTATSISANFTYRESDTINSSGLTVNGGTPTVIDTMVSAVNLQVSEVESNLQSSTSGSVFRFSADVADTLTGTYTVSGTVGGSPISIQKTYSGNVYNYHVACSYDSSAHTSMCSIN